MPTECAAAGGGMRAAGVATLFGILLGAVFVRRQRPAARPMIEPDLFRGHTVRVALLSNAVTFFALYGTQVAVAQYLQWAVGLSPLHAGLWSIPSVLAYLAATAIGPAAASRFPAVRVIEVGLLVAATGCAALAAAGGHLAMVVAGTMVFGIGLAPVYALSTDLIVTHARPERAGTAGAVAETSAELGGALGIALLGALGVAVYRGAMSGATAGLPPGGEVYRPVGQLPPAGRTGCPVRQDRSAATARSYAASASAPPTATGRPASTHRANPSSSAWYASG